jgi:type II secretion system protein N
MNVRPKSIKFWVSYAGYAFVVTVALLYFLFPGNTIRDYIERRVADSGSGVLLTIDSVKPALPIGLQFLGGKFSLRQSHIGPLRVERARIVPRIGACLSGKGAFNLHALAYSGKITGNIRFSGYRMSGPFGLNLHLEDIMLEEITAVRNLTGRSISGMLSGDITYDYESGAFLQGQGVCSFIVSNGSIELSLPFLSPGGIQFLFIEGVARLADHKLVLEKCDLDGDTLRCGLSGNITLHKNIEDSILDIRGEIEPLNTPSEKGNVTGTLLSLIGKQMNKEKFPFAIRGTIKDPKVTFM